MVPAHRVHHAAGRRAHGGIPAPRREGRAKPESRLRHLDRQRPAAGGAPAGTYAAVTPSEGLGVSMADLRKAARGRECQVRIPGVCNGNPDTSVLAHIRLAGLCGTGIKPPDLIATIACSSCHDEIDRRTRLVDADYAKECALEGMARTQVIWLKEGKVKA